MAAKENPYLQIALIIFVMVNVVLCVYSYYKFHQADELSAQQVAWESKSAKIKNEQLELLKMYSLLSTKVGHPEETPIETIQNAYREDMRQFGENFPREKRTYRELPTYLIAQIREKNTQAVDASAREQLLIAQKTQIQTVETNLKEVAVKSQGVLAQDLAAEKSAFENEARRINEEKSKIAGILDRRGKESADLIEATRGEVAALETDVTKTDQLNRAKDEKLKTLVEDTVESAHGQITYVNQSTRSVYINLGTDDGLMTQLSFSVFPEEETDISAGRKKGGIEILRVLKGKLAEARIVEDSIRDPIMPGDQIYSPVWRPGRRLRFALVGYFDIDDDSRDDRNQVRTIIQTNGGLVEAEVDNDGGRTGKMGINTRYLVVGQPPTEKTSRDAIAGYTSMIGEAQRLGIERISVADLLELMSWKGDVKSVQLGKGSRSEDFRVERDEAAPRSTGNTSGIFDQ